MKLNFIFDNKETLILKEFCGSNYKILKEVCGEHYVQNKYGKYTYCECFGFTSNKYFESLRYDKVIPCRIVCFARFYIMEAENEPNIFYRGTEMKHEKYEYDICGDSLEEILESI